MTANNVAKGMIDIFCRTGDPLIDRGAQFVGAPGRNHARHNRLTILRPQPHNLQSNGTLEWMHSTLESILAKSKTLGLDWVDQLPYGCT